MAQNEDDLQLRNLDKLPDIKYIETELYDSAPKEKPVIFKEYSLALIEAWRKGYINPQTVAYCIAGTMLISELKNVEDIDSLLWEAKVLELPFEEAYGSREEYMYEWNGFIERLEDLNISES